MLFFGKNKYQHVKLDELVTDTLIRSTISLKNILETMPSIPIHSNKVTFANKTN